MPSYPFAASSSSWIVMEHEEVHVTIRLSDINFNININWPTFAHQSLQAIPFQNAIVAESMVHQRVWRALGLGPQKTHKRGKDNDKDSAQPKLEVICPRISREDWICLLEQDEVTVPRWRFEVDGLGSMGRVVTYSRQTFVHSLTSAALVRLVKSQLVFIGQATTLEHSLTRPVSTVCCIGAYLQCPDDALVPNDARKDQLPTLVIEVAFINESTQDLRVRLERWVAHDSGVNVAIGVKIHADTRKKMIILLQRGGPIQVLEFGECDGRRIQFPLRLLCKGFTIPASLSHHTDDEVLIDLKELARTVNAAVHLQLR